MGERDGERGDGGGGGSRGKDAAYLKSRAEEATKMEERGREKETGERRWRKRLEEREGERGDGGEEGRRETI